MASRLHPADELARGIEALERQAAARPRDALPSYRLGVLYMALHGWTPKARLLARARERLTRAIELKPRHARSHAVLGYAYYLKNDAKRALAAFREARRLAPRDKVVEVYVFRLLVTLGRDKEALAAMEAAAPRHGANLAQLRRDLKKAGMRVDARAHVQAFINAPNFFRSSLEREAERILNGLKPGRARAAAAAQRARCAGDQKALERSFDASRVPASLRPLARWASRYGVGDDVCRPYLLRGLPKTQRAALIRAADKHAAAVQAWLGSFGDEVKPPEAAAYMYLVLGVEEIRD